MKRIGAILIILGLLCIIASYLTGCTKGCQKSIKHLKSSAIGLNRIVTVYDYEGQMIKSYDGKFQIEIESDSVVSFIQEGKERKIIGGIVIVEEQ